MPATVTSCSAWRLAPVAVCLERATTPSHCALRHRLSFTSFSRLLKPSRIVHALVSTMVLSETSGSRRLLPTAISGHTRGHTVTGGLWRLPHDALSTLFSLILSREPLSSLECEQRPRRQRTDLIASRHALLRA